MHDYRVHLTSFGVKLCIIINALKLHGTDINVHEPYYLSHI